MVKLPNLDDLKKMGSDLIDSAKSVKLNEIVDKFKTSIESVSSKKGASDQRMQDQTLEQIFIGIYASLKELAVAQATQEAVVKKVENQLNFLAKELEQYQKSTGSPVASSSQPDKEPNQEDAHNEAHKKEVNQEEPK